MKYSVEATEENHLRQLYEVIDAVAREGKYLAFTQAPPWEESRAFYRSILKRDFPYFVARSGENVVGWVDVAPLMGQTRAHIGVLGIGLLPEARHQGIGIQLMRAAIEKSWSIGLSRIELSVREDNLNAKALYEKLGFEFEGRRRRGSVIGSESHDVLAMALLR